MLKQFLHILLLCLICALARAGSFTLEGDIHTQDDPYPNVAARIKNVTGANYFFGGVEIKVYSSASGLCSAGETSLVNLSDDTLVIPNNYIAYFKGETLFNLFQSHFDEPPSGAKDFLFSLTGAFNGVSTDPSIAFCIQETCSTSVCTTVETRFIAPAD